jgi:hypothetical protein
VNFVPVFPDVATDSLGNFYLFDAFLEKIVAYTPSGIPIDTFYTTGSMGATGGGFALLGNRFYAESIYTLHEGIVVGDSVFFSVAVSHPTLHTNDLATCPVSGFPVAVFEYPELPHFAVFPNPATDIAYIRFENTLALKVYDQLGKQCRNISVEGLSEYQLDVEQLDQGVYFITAISKTNTTATMKLLVQ